MKRKEMWENVSGYEDLYKVSNYGKILRLKNGNIMANIKNPDGYPMIGLTKNKIVKRFLVHRLVAIAFIPNPKNKETVNHIDGDRGNSFVGNLEWATRSENELHAYRKLGKKVNKPMAGKFGAKHNRSIPIAQLLMDGVTVVKNFSSAMEAERETGIKCNFICRCSSGERKSTGGFKWKRL